eukprot:GHVS01061580.1.p3 GENE.GHVS01061580.1~~GHVS01061580.1.p3  ORF type:complete len:110 (+),score=9.84 GHVS01061580.1:1326-1655(+)
MAIDYRMVNKQLVDDSYPMPLLWEILRFAALSPESRKYTAFVTPMGTYEWTVLPFGLKTAPSEFQRVIDHTIRPLGRVVRAREDLTHRMPKGWVETGEGREDCSSTREG